MCQMKTIFGVRQAMSDIVLQILLRHLQYIVRTYKAQAYLSIQCYLQYTQCLVNMQWSCAYLIPRQMYFSRHTS